MPHRIKQKIAAGESVMIVNTGGNNPDVVETLAHIGADLVFIDCERMGLGLDSATDLIRAARANGMACVVRSPSKQPETIVQFLDRNADGVVVPRVDSAQEAAAVVEVQIESRAAVAAVDEMAAVPGIDVFLIGPADLAWDMTGNKKSTPEVQAAVDHVCARLSAAGCRFGMPCPEGSAARFRKRGATFAYYHLEWLLRRSWKEFARELKEGKN